MPETAPAVLVANRGEIAVRILRTLRRVGWPSVAVYSDADATARHVREADTAVRLGGADPADSYLNTEAVIAAALDSGARLVHPGYGFLSENAGFARACAEAGLVFVGPPPEAIALMGDKIRAKETAAGAGTPVLPGFAERPGQPVDDAELAAAASEVGYPLLLKPAAGGGGKGMRRVDSPGGLAEAAAAARREALASFGDATLLVERFVEHSRHIEVQILADARGGVVHLGERECSLQRRHQKIVEEAPSPLLTPAARAAMGEAAVAAAKACGYVGAGTVEFIVDPGHGDREVPGEPLASSEADLGAGRKPPAPRLGTTGHLDFAFLEMNTRLQVEHPVTEAVTTVGGRRGIDLVELQLRIALGGPLPFTQGDLGHSGHAVEARVYAEDPARGFLPTGGRVMLLSEPEGEGIRVDSGVEEGGGIGSAYDPMLAKVVAWAPDRTGALDRLDAALAHYTLLGCSTNVAFLRELLRQPEVAEGHLDTGFVERVSPLSTPGADAPVLAAAALDRHLSLEPAEDAVDRFDIPDGWRVGGPAWTTWRLAAPGLDPAQVRVRRAPGTAEAEPRFEVAVADGVPLPASARRGDSGRALTVHYGGRAIRYSRAAADGELWLGRGGAAWMLREEVRLAPLRRTEAAAGGTLRSPMPGTVLAVPAELGQAVSAGDTVAVIEAMKMEHAVTSPVEGTVSRLEVQPGQSVAMDAVVAVIASEEAVP